MLGTQALAAVSGMFPILFFFIALVIGLGAGAGVLIGQAYGAGETGTVKALAGTTLLLAAIIGRVAAVLGSVFARKALQGLGTQLGRASCRERVWPYVSTWVVDVSLKKKKK